MLRRLRRLMRLIRLPKSGSVLHNRCNNVCLVLPRSLCWVQTTKQDRLGQVAIYLCQLARLS